MIIYYFRIPKLPVGVECTLGLIQVCLRDSEWMPKINNNEMSVLYENDLQMMYSTVIMKFLNHISNIANNKHISLFIIAKQLNIPDWIVDLRHDIAHGYELPSIDVMRIVANILLTWLHVSTV
jgi:ribosomal biogenesis protein LAS1